MSSIPYFGRVAPSSFSALFGGLIASGFLLLGLGGCSPSSDQSADGVNAGLIEATAAAVRRSEAFDHEIDFLRAVRTSLQEVGGKSMIVTPDGALHVQSLRAYHQWNSTAQGRPTSRATDFEDPNHPIHEIVARAEKLRQEGVDYLYVMVPNRLETYPELLLPELAGLPDFPGMNPGTLRFQAELVQRGVHCVPLLGAFADNRFGPDGSRWLFLRTQPILTPGGVALTALHIVEAVRGLDWFEQGPALEGVDYQVQQRTISQNAPLPPELEGQPGFEKPDNLAIEAVLTPEGLAAHVPDRESPIVLLGDNAVVIFDQLGGDLASQLYRVLGQRIDVVAAPHGDYWASFERRPDALRGKRVVIEVQSIGFRLPPTPHEPLPEQ